MRQRNAELRHAMIKKQNAMNPEAQTLEENPHIDYKMLISKKLEDVGNKIQERPLMEQGLIPGALHSVLYIGGSASGKTTHMINSMKNIHMYKDFYNKVYLFSTSGKLDPSFKQLEIPEENIITSDTINRLDEILSAQKQEIEDNGWDETELILLIFEDITSQFRLLKSDLMCCLVTMGRHLKVGLHMMAHKYKSLPPVVRLNASQILFWPCNQGQMYQIYEDWAPGQINKKTFYKMIYFAWEPTAEDQRPFFMIDVKSRHDKKFFRKGLYYNICPNR